MTLDELPPIEPPLENAPTIGIIDSGINANPLLDTVIVGSIGVPPALGTADENGHGTRVGGIAVFGDIRAQIANGLLVCRAKARNGESAERKRQIRRQEAGARTNAGCVDETA